MLFKDILLALLHISHISLFNSEESLLPLNETKFHMLLTDMLLPALSGATLSQTEPWWSGWKILTALGLFSRCHRVIEMQ